MQISRRFGINVIPEKYMDILLVSHTIDKHTKLVSDKKTLFAIIIKRIIVLEEK